MHGKSLLKLRVRNNYTFHIIYVLRTLIAVAVTNLTDFFHYGDKPLTSSCDKKTSAYTNHFAKWSRVIQCDLSIQFLNHKDNDCNVRGKEGVFDAV